MTYYLLSFLELKNNYLFQEEIVGPETVQIDNVQHRGLAQVRTRPKEEAIVVYPWNAIIVVENLEVPVGIKALAEVGDEALAEIEA